MLVLPQIIRTEWCSDTSSPSLAPHQASGRYDGWLVDSIPPCSAKTVEAHIPSYLINVGETGMYLTLDSIFRSYATMRNLGSSRVRREYWQRCGEDHCPLTEKSSISEMERIFE
jgi:hypothetical protein